MVRKKVKTQFLLFKNPNKLPKNKQKQTNKQATKHGKEKGKNSILSFEKKKHNMVRKKK